MNHTTPSITQDALHKQEKRSNQPYAVERWAMNQDVRTAQGKLILIIMSVDANAQGYAWTRQRVIAERAQCSRQCVNEWFAELEETGLIATRPQYRDDGGKSSKEWILLFRDGLTWPDGIPAQRPRVNGDHPHVNEDDMGVVNQDPHVNGGRHGYVNGGRHGMSTGDDMGMSTGDDIMKRQKEETREETTTTTTTTGGSAGSGSERERPTEEGTPSATPLDSSDSSDSSATRVSERSEPRALIGLYLDWKAEEYPEKAGLRDQDLEENSAEWISQLEAVQPPVTTEELRAALDRASRELGSTDKKDDLRKALKSRNAIQTILGYVTKGRKQTQKAHGQASTPSATPSAPGLKHQPSNLIRLVQPARRAS